MAAALAGMDCSARPYVVSASADRQAAAGYISQEKRFGSVIDGDLNTSVVPFRQLISEIVRTLHPVWLPIIEFIGVKIEFAV